MGLVGQNILVEFMISLDKITPDEIASGMSYIYVKAEVRTHELDGVNIYTALNLAISPSEFDEEKLANALKNGYIKLV